MRFAPVIIPTLNRSEHLDKCLSSLGKNGMYARNTEVYVSVDYPPDDRYLSGYREVRKLLNWYSEHHSFSKLIIYYQDKNLGPSRNSVFLMDEIKKAGFDRFIYSEDDNEFAPNFLAYVDKGLDLFEQDDSIVSINGFKDIEWMNTYQENIIGVKLFPAYGYGAWVKKREHIWSEVESFLLSPDMMAPQMVMKLYKRNRYLFALYVNGIVSQESGVFWGSDSKFRVVDSAISIYLHLTDRMCIVPEKTKVHNWGFDGSGVNMGKRDRNNGHELELDASMDFDYSCNKIEYDDANYSLGNKYLCGTGKKWDIWSACIKYLVFILLGRNRKRLIALRRMLKGGLR